MKTILVRLSILSATLGCLTGGLRAQTTNTAPLLPLPSSPPTTSTPAPIAPGPTTPATTSPAPETKPKADKPKKSAPKPANTFYGTVTAINTNAMSITFHGTTKDRTFLMGSQSRLAHGKTPLMLSEVKVGNYIRGTFKKTGKGPETIVSATVTDKAPAAAVKKPKKAATVATPPQEK